MFPEYSVSEKRKDKETTKRVQSNLWDMTVQHNT